MSDVKIGDRVAWTGWFDFGKTPKRCVGRVTHVGLGVPYYHDPPQFTDDGYALEAGRHPAVAVAMDLPQHGITEVKIHTPLKVIAIYKLERLDA